MLGGTLAREARALARRRTAPVLHGLALLTGYLGLVIWLTWPLATALGSSLLSRSCDLYYSTWVLSHESHALVSPGVSLADANIYHPAESALFYGPAALGALPLFAPVFLATSNAVLAINVTFLLGIALTGVSMHLVVRRWTGSDLAGVVGAATVVINPWLTRSFVPNTPHWAALFWLPPIAFLAAARLHSMRATMLVGMLVALQCLTDIVYVTPAVLGPLCVLAAARLARSRTRAVGLRSILVLVLAAAALAPLLRGYRAVREANPDLATQTNWAVAEADKPAVLPERLRGGRGPFHLTPVVLGLIVAGIAARVWRRRTGPDPARPPEPGCWAHGALWAVVGGVLSLTPVVRIGGEEFLTPLGHLRDWIPEVRVVRVPSRLGIAGIVGLGLLSGAAFAEITALIRTLVHRRHLGLGLSGLLAALLLSQVHRTYGWNNRDSSPGDEVNTHAEHRLHVAPTVPATFLPFLESARTPLIELPQCSPLHPQRHALAMLHSISHWRPLLNGYSSYWPAAFPERMDLANRLPAQDALDQLVESTGLAMVWVHAQRLPRRGRAVWESPPDTAGFRHRLRLVAREDSELLFAVDPPPTLAER